MGHSILVYKDRHVRLRDIDLIVAVLLMTTTYRRSLDASDEILTSAQELRGSIDALQRSVMTWEVGYLDVELDEIVTSEAVRRYLVRAFVAAQAALEGIDHFDGVDLLREAFGPDLAVHTTKEAIAASLDSVRRLLSTVDAPPREGG